MSVDMVIKNCKLVSPDSITDSGIAIDKGVVVAVGCTNHLPPAERVIDAQGNYILPGIVDEHVHLLDMDLAEDWERFDTGSMAAAVGGVTTVCEMPLTVPPTTSVEAFEKKRSVAESKFFVDFALWGGAIEGNTEQIALMAEAGAVGFKSMMAGSVPGVFEIVDDGWLLEILNAIMESKSLLIVHAENEAIVNRLESKLKAEGRKDIHAYFASRPIIQELEAISRVARLAQEAECRLHICHVSCPQGIDLIWQRASEGQAITAETGPQYLAISEEDGDRLGPYMKIAPPPRARKEVDILWEQLAAGKILTLGSDHGAHPKESKERGWADIWQAGNGALGLETFLPVMLSEGVNRGRISLRDVAATMSRNPAQLLGLYPQKGTLEIGSDADLVIVDLQKSGVVDARKFHSLNKYSPFDGMRITGWPILTMVRGQVVARDGKIVGSSGFGRFVRPKAQNENRRAKHRNQTQSPDSG